jgi:hypothetical protein
LSLTQNLTYTQEYFDHDWQLQYFAVVVLTAIDLFVNRCIFYTNPFRPFVGILRARQGRRFYEVLKKMMPGTCDLHVYAWYAVLLVCVPILRYKNWFINLPFQIVLLVCLWCINFCFLIYLALRHCTCLLYHRHDAESYATAILRSCRDDGQRPAVRVHQQGSVYAHVHLLQLVLPHLHQRQLSPRAAGRGHQEHLLPPVLLPVRLRGAAVSAVAYCRRYV